jgi:serine/threonine protein kinase
MFPGPPERIFKNEKEDGIEGWSSLRPVPETFKVLIDNLTSVTTRKYLESKGYEYPSSARYHNFIAESVQNERNFLGKGGKGRVYSFVSPDAPNTRICIKVMQHMEEAYHIADRGNDPIAEFRLQSKVSTLNQQGTTKYPRPLQLLDCTDSFYALVMEELPAMNLQNVLLGRDTVPEGFNVKECMDRLYEYVDELHEAGIIHNDLEARNIMLDMETGAPYIIDFGRSVKLDDMEESLQAKRLREGDYNNLDIIERNLTGLLMKKAA